MSRPAQLCLVYVRICSSVNQIIIIMMSIAVVKQLRGQSVIHQPQLALVSTDNTDDIAAADDDGDELDENVIGKYLY